MSQLSRAMLPLRAYTVTVTRHALWCNCLECEPLTPTGRARTDDPEPELVEVRVVRYAREVPVNVDVTT